MECSHCGYFLKSTDVYCPRCQKLKEMRAADPTLQAEAAPPVPHPAQFQELPSAAQSYPPHPYPASPVFSPEARTLHVLAIIGMSFAAACDLVLLLAGSIYYVVTSSMSDGSDRPTGLLMLLVAIAALRCTGFVLYLTARKAFLFLYPPGSFLAFLLPIVAAATDRVTFNGYGAAWLLFSVVLGGLTGYACWMRKEAFL